MNEVGKKLIIYICVSIGIFALVLDSQRALNGAVEGIDICIRTVIPSLFPFFIVSILLTSAVSTTKIPLLTPLRKLCRIPEGSEAILLIGLLGGYPVGAQCISNAYKSGQLTKVDAQRMLGFCNNAGPAFLFGMLGQLFDSKTAALLLWSIHIVAALLTGMVLPGKPGAGLRQISTSSNNNGQIMRQSIGAMANVCGWVVIFRVILCFMKHWIFWILPRDAQIMLFGILELSNGCIELYAMESIAGRFIFSSVFLSMGGVCVLMQTLASVSQAGLDLGMYIPGKILQTSFSFILAVASAQILFSPDTLVPKYLLPIPALIIAGVLLFMKKKENNSSIPAFGGV